MKLLQIRSGRTPPGPGADARLDPSQRARFTPLRTKLFCALPFTAINIMENGDVYPDCCSDWVEFPLGNLFAQSWSEVWNGQNARRLRRSMQRGDLRHCDRHWCPHIQNALGGIDDPNVVPRGARRHLDLPADARSGSVEMSEGPVRVGLHYDDSCNLACPTCRAGVHMVNGEALERMGRLHAVVAAEVLPHARSFSLTGTGDPFASAFLRAFLEGFDRAQYPKLERVHLHTNATMWSRGLWARMPALHEIEVTTDVSVDAACAATYEVVRRPARWDRLQENLEFIVTIPNLSALGVSMTVSQLNVAELVAFHDWARVLAERCPEKFVFVEYKRVRRRGHHTDDQWRSLGLEHLDDPTTKLLLAQLRELEGRRPRGRPEIRSNLGELLEVGGR